VSQIVLECIVSSTLSPLILFQILTLHVHTPFQRIQAECLQSALLA
jgi:hypothetical protein